jgi:adenylate kinase
LILLGPPGSGKGTQALQLCQRYNIGHVSTGDILRRNTQRGTSLGKDAEEYLQAGDLVPDSLIFDMLEDLYHRAGGESQGFILDGFPRSESQAEALSEFLESRGQGINRVLLLELADDVLVGRLVQRRTCPKCGRSYHLLASPPLQEGHCDTDGTPLVWRPDDHEEVIRNRLQTYHAQTEPVAAFYARRGLLSKVDASRPIQEITHQLCSLVDSLHGKSSAPARE